MPAVHVLGQSLSRVRTFAIDARKFWGTAQYASTVMKRDPKEAAVEPRWEMLRDMPLSTCVPAVELIAVTSQAKVLLVIAYIFADFLANGAE